MRLPATIAGVFLIAVANVPAQQALTPQDSARYFAIEECSPLSCLLSLLPPLALQHSVDLKGFLRSRTFARLRTQYGDRRAVDAIFVRAMRLTNNNSGMALLLATAATMDHDMVGLKVPIVELYIPLTSESTEEFHLRIGNLPTRIFTDSPREGDRDKLQHFFGSASITVLFGSSVPADNFGEFVEVGEDAFIVGGKLDTRDRRTNRRGQAFGVALLDDIHHLPSEFLDRRPAPRAPSLESAE